MDTGDWTLLSLWVHIPLVTAWIGSVMWDTFASSAPGLSDEQRGRLITWWRPFTIAAIVVILVTGVWQTMKNPFNEVGSYADLKALRDDTTYGMALFRKHGCVIATFVLTLAVRFYLAPRLLRGSTAGGDNPMPAAVTTTGATVTTAVGRDLAATRWLSALNLLACLGALIFATQMVWELH